MGLGVAQNYPEAIKWFEKAAYQGHIEAQYNLGMMYYQGYGVGKNIETARKWLLLAEKQGDQLATKQLTDIDAFHQFNAAIDNNNPPPRSEASRTEESVAAKPKDTENQKNYLISEPEVIVQQQAEPEPVIKNQGTQIPEQDITAQKQNKPKPEPVVSAQKQNPSIPEQVIIAQKQSTSKPEPVVSAQKQNPSIPEPVIMAQKQKTPKPEPVVSAQKQNPSIPEPVIMAQKQKTPKPEPVVSAKKQNTSIPEQVIIAQKQTVSRPKPQAHNANEQQEQLAETLRNTPVASEPEQQILAKEKINTKIHHRKQNTKQQPAEPGSQQNGAYESDSLNNKAQQKSKKIDKLPSTEPAATKIAGNEKKFNTNSSHQNISGSKTTAISTVATQKSVMAKVNILPLSSVKVKAVKLPNTVVSLAKIPLAAVPKVSIDEKSIAENTDTVTDHKPAESQAENNAASSTEIVAEKTGAQAVEQNNSSGSASEANAFDAKNASQEQTSSNIKPENNTHVAISPEKNLTTKTTSSESHLPKFFYAMFVLVIVVIVWLLTALFMWLRIKTLSRTNLVLVQEHRNIKHSLSRAKERVHKIQEELNLNIEQINKEKLIAENEAQRALEFETQLNEHNSQLVDVIHKLATNFDLDKRLLLVSGSISTDILWKIQNEVMTLVIEHLEIEKETRVGLQQAFQAEAAKLAEKDTLLDLLKSQMDAQSRDFVLLNQGLESQIYDLQKQHDSNQNELSSTLKKLEAEQTTNQIQVAKLAETEILVKNIQIRLDSETAQSAKVEQELRQQISALQHQLDDNQNELSNTVTRFREDQAVFLEEARKRAEKEVILENLRVQIDTEKEQFDKIEQERNQQIVSLQQQLDNAQMLLSDATEKFKSEQSVAQAAEVRKRTENEVIIETMQTQIDAQKDQFAKIEQERNQQIVSLQQQLESTQNVLSDTMEKYKSDQLIYQAELIKRAEKEAFLEALQDRIDSQTSQFAKMELELKEQKTMLKEQLDNTQRVLSDTLEKHQPLQVSLEEEEAKRAEKEALFDTLQTIMETQNNQFAKLEQDLEQQQAILQQQQDNIQKVLTDNLDTETERASQAEDELASKPSFFDMIINEVGDRLNTLFGGK
jgi:hypothetical protein